MIEIVPSTSDHVRELSKSLREKDKAEALALGIDPKKGLFYAYKNACYRKTALVNGEVAAMWGLHGELLGSLGHPYFITGSLVETISPLTFTRIYKNEVSVMKGFFPVLENFVDASYSEAIRLLKIAGFKIGKPMCYGPEDKLFCKYTFE